MLSFEIRRLTLDVQRYASGEPRDEIKTALETLASVTNCIEVHLSLPAKNVSLADLARRTEGYSGADIEGVCREAGILALRKNIDAKEVTIRHFEEALKMVSGSLDEATIKYYNDIGKELQGGMNKRQKDDIGLGYYR